MRRSIGERCLARVPASSEFGDGTMYVTTHAVAYEVDRRGIYLNFIPRSAVSGIEVMSKSAVFGERKCRLVWVECRARNAFEFRTRQHGLLDSALRRGGGRT